MKSFRKESIYKSVPSTRSFSSENLSLSPELAQEAGKGRFMQKAIMSKSQKFIKYVLPVVKQLNKFWAPVPTGLMQM